MSLNHGDCQLYAARGTITVPDDYSSIQAAINAANAGDTVYVRNGTYYELVNVNKTVSLVGENKDTTVIDGSGFPNSGVLAIYGVSNATVQDLTVQNATIGLLLVNANYTRLRNISLRNNQQNIYLDLLSLQNTTYDIDESNTVDGKPVYFWINRENEEIPSDAGYVALINCNNVTVQGLILTKDGITLANVKDCLIENETITETQTPLQIIDTENCTIRNSLFNNSVSGVKLWNVSQLSFTNNTVSNVTQDDAVFLNGSFNTLNENTILNNSGGHYGLHVVGDRNLIIANKILNNTYGIKIEYSSNNKVSGNEVEGNLVVQLELSNSTFNTISANQFIGAPQGLQGWGLVLAFDSNNNIIIENLIEDNYCGIQIMASENNSIFHNNIEGNDLQAKVYPTGGGYYNTWDSGYPSGGNHWSDYTGTDSDHDGIGDTIYGIYDGNIDNYPLMNLYMIPEFSYLMTITVFVFFTLAVAVILKRRKSRVLSQT